MGRQSGKSQTPVQIPDFDPTKPFTYLTPGPQADTRKLYEPPPAPDIDLTGLDEGDGSWMGMLTNFGKNFVETVNPYPLLKSLYETSPMNPVFNQRVGKALISGKKEDVDAALNPSRQLMTNMVKPSWDNIQKAKEAYDQGRYTEAAAYTLGAIPFLGTGAVHAGEQLAESFEGNTAVDEYGIPVGGARVNKDKLGAGLGTTAGVVSPFAAKPAARVAARVTEKVRQPVAAAARSVADTTMSRVMAPDVGTNRVRLGAVADEVAPAVAKHPKLSALNREQLRVKIGEMAETAEAAVDARLAKLPADAPVPVGGLKKAIRAEITKLGVREGGDGAWKPLSGNEARIQALETILDDLKDVKGLTISDLQTLRKSWSNEAIPADFPTTRAAAKNPATAESAYQSARDILDAHLEKWVPGLSKVRAEATLWDKARRVMDLADGGGSGRGRSVSVGVSGAITGFATGGSIGAAIGSVLAPMLDRALISGKTAQIGVSRGLSRLAESLENGNLSAVPGILESIGKTTGKPVTQDFRETWGRLQRIIKDETGEIKFPQPNWNATQLAIKEKEIMDNARTRSKEWLNKQDQMGGIPSDSPIAKRHRNETMADELIAGILQNDRYMKSGGFNPEVASRNQFLYGEDPKFPGGISSAVHVMKSADGETATIMSLASKIPGEGRQIAKLILDWAKENGIKTLKGDPISSAMPFYRRYGLKDAADSESGYAALSVDEALKYVDPAKRKSLLKDEAGAVRIPDWFVNLVDKGQDWIMNSRFGKMLKDERGAVGKDITPANIEQMRKSGSDQLRNKVEQMIDEDLDAEEALQATQDKGPVLDRTGLDPRITSIDPTAQLPDNLGPEAQAGPAPVPPVRPNPEDSVALATRARQTEIQEAARAQQHRYSGVVRADDPPELQQAIADWANSQTMPGFTRMGDPKKVVDPVTGMTEADVQDLVAVRRNMQREEQMPKGGDFSQKITKIFPHLKGQFDQVVGYNEGAVSVRLKNGSGVTVGRDDITGIALPDGVRDYQQLGHAQTVMDPKQFDGKGNFIPRTATRARQTEIQQAAQNPISRLLKDEKGEIKLPNIDPKSRLGRLLWDESGGAITIGGKTTVPAIDKLVPKGEAAAGRREFLQRLTQPLQEAGESLTKAEDAAPGDGPLTNIGDTVQRTVTGEPISRREFGQVMGTGLKAAQMVMNAAPAAAAAAAPAAVAPVMPVAVKGWTLAKEIALSNKHLGLVQNAVKRIERQALLKPFDAGLAKELESARKTLQVAEGRVHVLKGMGESVPRMIEREIEHLSSAQKSLDKYNEFIAQGKTPIKADQNWYGAGDPRNVPDMPAPPGYGGYQYFQEGNARYSFTPDELRRYAEENAPKIAELKQNLEAIKSGTVKDPTEYIRSGQTDSARMRSASNRAEMRALRAEGHNVSPAPATINATSESIIQRPDGMYLRGKNQWVSDPAQATPMSQMKLREAMAKLRDEGIEPKVHDFRVKHMEPRAGQTQVWTTNNMDTRARQVNLKVDPDVLFEDVDTIANELARAHNPPLKDIKIAPLTEKRGRSDNGMYNYRSGHPGIRIRGVGEDGKTYTIDYSTSGTHYGLRGGEGSEVGRFRKAKDTPARRPTKAKDKYYYISSNTDTIPGLREQLATDQRLRLGDHPYTNQLDRPYVFKIRLKDVKDSEVLNIKYKNAGGTEYSQGAIRKIIEANTDMDIGSGPVAEAITDIVNKFDIGGSAEKIAKAAETLGWANADWAKRLAWADIPAEMARKAGYKIIVRKGFGKNDVQVVDPDVVDPISSKNAFDPFSKPYKFIRADRDK